MWGSVCVVGFCRRCFSRLKSTHQHSWKSPAEAKIGCLRQHPIRLRTGRVGELKHLSKVSIIASGKATGKAWSFWMSCFVRIVDGCQMGRDDYGVNNCLLSLQWQAWDLTKKLAREQWERKKMPKCIESLSRLLWFVRLQGLLFWSSVEMFAIIWTHSNQ